ncbi:MAG: hypothetical protein HWE30_15710 [Methylocystaceae bacterium]|nr:hypothetical protein [Methylocystaceae bacterium]
MFEVLDDVANSVGNFFSIDNAVTPDTAMSNPDAIKTGTALSDLGYFGQNGESEFSLPNSVKAFQDTHGLKVDGIINKGGPTEKAISGALEQQSLSTTDPMKAAQKALPPHVTASKPASSKPDQKSWTASASFGDGTITNKPKAPPKPKIDPMTALLLASSPKGKMPTAKQWEEVAKMQKQKAKAAIIPQGETVQKRIQSMMQDNRYGDKNDTRLRDHVVQQFEKAYPGQVQYDETGKMVQPVASIKPEEVEPFDPDGQLLPQQTIHMPLRPRQQRRMKRS